MMNLDEQRLTNTKVERHKDTKTERPQNRKKGKTKRQRGRGGMGVGYHKLLIYCSRSRTIDQKFVIYR